MDSMKEGVETMARTKCKAKRKRWYKLHSKRIQKVIYNRQWRDCFVRAGVLPK